MEKGEKEGTVVSQPSEESKKAEAHEWMGRKAKKRRKLLLKPRGGDKDTRPPAGFTGTQKRPPKTGQRFAWFSGAFREKT